MWCEIEQMWTGVCAKISQAEVGYKWAERKWINYFMLNINLKFIVVCIFLLPGKAALHHGWLILQTEKCTKREQKWGR